MSIETVPVPAETNGLTEKAHDQSTAAVKDLNHDTSTNTPKLPHSAADGLIKTPFDIPLESCKPTVRPALTAEQQEKYVTALAEVSKWTEVPDSLEKGAKLAPLTDSERMFMTRECLLRYLRADKWNVTQAMKRLKDTISWRRGYGVEKLTADYISVENETGKQILLGYDNETRPCHYMRPSKQNTEKSDRQIEHLVFMLEKVIDLMPPGQETVTLVVNFAETKAGQGATVGQARQTMYILQNHYPERLGRALVTNVPWLIWGFFKVIRPFIDPFTYEKIRFNEPDSNHIPKEQLMKENGGNVEFEYDHATYWDALNKECDARSAAHKARWEKAGKRIGESETYLKGGDEKSIAEQEAESKANGAESHIA